MKNNNIDHKGVVTAVNADIVTVEILNKSACSSCHAKGICAASDEKIKVIEVKNFYGADYSIGEEVKVCLKKTLGLRAVVISYVIPLVVLLLFLSLQSFFKNELVTGLISIAALAVYYFVVYLCRDKIGKKFTFTIEKMA